MDRVNIKKILKKQSWNLFAVILILWGIVSFFTPLTPGSWLFFIGLFILFGKEATEKALLKILGQNLFKKLHISKLIDKLPRIKRG